MKVYYATRTSDLGATMAASILTEQPPDQTVLTGYHQRPPSLPAALEEINAAAEAELQEWIAPQITHLRHRLRAFINREIAAHRRSFRGAYS
jgi:hypothetical protein